VKALRPLVEKHGIEEVAARYLRYVTNTPGRYYDAWKLGVTWADWSLETMLVMDSGNGAPRGPPQKVSAAEQSIINTELALGVKLR
jgi:hypothetical protein